MEELQQENTRIGEKNHSDSLCGKRGKMKKEVFSFDYYCDLIKGKKNMMDCSEYKYKDKFIPKYLYKYWTFRSSHIDENIERLLAGEIWMPLATTLNDPFEFQMIKDNLSEEQKLEFRTCTINTNSVLSLCANHNNNLLWSHYSWAHTGLCLEFEVVNSTEVFPIIYSKCQDDDTFLIKKWLIQKNEVLKKKIDDLTNEELYLINRLRRIMLTKKYDWKYEKEYRITRRQIIEDEDNMKLKTGYWENLSRMGLKLKRIILGFNCDLQNKAKVIEQVNHANKKLITDEMIRTDFKYTMVAVTETLREYGDIITLGQKKRRGDSISLYIQELNKDGVYYKG